MQTCYEILESASDIDGFFDNRSKLREIDMDSLWRKLHNEIRNLYTSPSLIRMIKSKRFRLAGHVARMERS
jgi:hypothetical protein